MGSYDSEPYFDKWALYRTMVQGKNRKINYKVKECRPVAEENWIRVEKTHEAIIAEEIFQYVQSLLDLDTVLHQMKILYICFRDFYAVETADRTW